MSRSTVQHSGHCRAGFLLKGVLLLAVACSHAAIAQNAQPGDRSHRRLVDERSLVVLQGNVHPLVASSKDNGVAPRSMRANRLLLILKRSPSQEDDLQAFLKSVQNRSSPDYRRFLTPEEFGKRFGPSDEDLSTLETWLRSHGLDANKVSKGRTAIEFSGTVAQLEQTFHTSIHQYVSHGSAHWLNSSNPMIPSALAPLVAGVASLNDLKPRSQLVHGPVGHWSPATHRFTPALTATLANQDFLLMTPGDAATVYNAPNPLNRSWPTGQSQIDGTGVTIGVVEDTQPDLSGLFNYESSFGLPQGGHVNIVYDSDPNTADYNLDDQTEALLDVEVAQGLAPGAQLNLYTAGNTVFQPGVFLAALRAVDDNAVNILSVSYSSCEADLGAAGNLEILNAWEQAAAQGITVLVSSGDSGSAGCDDPDTETAAASGFAVSGLASTPFNVAVGGADFTVLSSGFSKYVSATSLSNGTSALGYIPEAAWNDSAATPGLLATNSAFTDANGHTNIVAAGGGASGPAAYSKPAWQQEFTASNGDALRDLPDVSLFAGDGRYQAAWAICELGDCSGEGSTIHSVGGTSAAAPAFAGILAMVNQKIGASARLGQANWVLYQLAQTTPAIFHAPAASNNAVVCASGSPNCGANGFLTGYNTAAGYSLAAGLGSVDITQLVNGWDGDARLSTSTSLSLDKTSFIHGTSVNITAGVTPSAATGLVAVVNSAGTQPNAQNSTPGLTLTLAGGSASGSTTQFPGGQYAVFGTYGGDAGHSGSASPAVAMNVTPEDSVLNFSVQSVSQSGQLASVAGSTVPLGTLLAFRGVPVGVSQVSNPNPLADAAGSVFFGDNNPVGYSSCHAQAPVNATGAAEFDTQYCLPADHAMTAQYSGDLSYNASTAGPINFTIAKGSTTLALSTTANTIAFGQVNVTASLTPSWFDANLYPQGPVVFTDTTNNTVLETQNAELGNCSVGQSLCVSAGLGIYPELLAPGANVITASFSGDSNYNASSPSTPITITCTAGCTNNLGQRLEVTFYSPSQRVLDPGESATLPVTITAYGGFSGNVAMTCSVAGQNPGDAYIPTCSFSPSNPAVSATQGGSTTLTFQTTGSMTGSLAPANRTPWQTTAGAALAGVLLLGLSTARRRWGLLFTAIFSCALFTGMLGCGGGSGGGTGGGGGGGGEGTAPATTADTYTVTIRAADAATGTLAAQNSFNFTVE